MELFISFLTYAVVGLLLISVTAHMMIARKNGDNVSLSSLLMKPFFLLTPHAPISDPDQEPAREDA